MLTEKQKKDILNKIEIEGSFEYFFLNYTDCSEYHDDPLEDLVKQYREVTKKLAKYVGLQDDI